MYNIVTRHKCNSQVITSKSSTHLTPFSYYNIFNYIRYSPSLLVFFITHNLYILISAPFLLSVSTTLQIGNHQNMFCIYDFISGWLFCILDSRLKWNHIYLSFSVWLILLSIIPSRSCCRWQHFIRFNDWIILHSISLVFFLGTQISIESFSLVTLTLS